MMIHEKVIRVGLQKVNMVYCFYMKNKKNLIGIVLFGGLLLSPLFFVSVPRAKAECDALDTQCLKDAVDKYEKKYQKAQEQASAIEKDLSQINSSLTSTQQAILRVQNLLKQTTQTISQKEAEIDNLNEQARLERTVLTGLIQELYYSENNTIVEAMLSKDDLLTLFQNHDNLFSTQEKIQALIEEIKDTKQKVETEKVSLLDTKKDHEELLVIQDRQKRALVTDKIETEQDLGEAQATVAELKSKLNELNGDLNKLLGKSYNAKNIKDAIQFAGDKTGVREGFLFGMLSVESRLGASVGGCDYKQSRMSSYRLGIFMDIADSLDYNYKKLKVSCPPSSYKGTGGAMGAAQFMSDTWKGYASTIASRTGHNPPDPWNLTDGVMAMASKLANDGATKSGKTTITSPCNGKKTSIKWETYAAMRYLGWSCYALNNYSVNIQRLSGNYKDL